MPFLSVIIYFLKSIGVKSSDSNTGGESQITFSISSENRSVFFCLIISDCLMISAISRGG